MPRLPTPSDKAAKLLFSPFYINLIISSIKNVIYLIVNLCCINISTIKINYEKSIILYKSEVWALLFLIKWTIIELDNLFKCLFLGQFCFLGYGICFKFGYIYYRNPSLSTTCSYMHFIYSTYLINFFKKITNLIFNYEDYLYWTKTFRDRFDEVI